MGTNWGQLCNLSRLETSLRLMFPPQFIPQTETLLQRNFFQHPWTPLTIKGAHLGTHLTLPIPGGSSSSAPRVSHHPKATAPRASQHAEKGRKYRNRVHPCSQLTFKGFRWGFASLNLWGKHAFAKNLSIKTCIIEGDLGVLLQLLGQVGPGGCWDHVGPVASILRDLQLLHKAHRPADETVNSNYFSFPWWGDCWEGTRQNGGTAAPCS